MDREPVPHESLVFWYYPSTEPTTDDFLKLTLMVRLQTAPIERKLTFEISPLRCQLTLRFNWQERLNTVHYQSDLVFV